jgi:hypothetical protein
MKKQLTLILLVTAGLAAACIAQPQTTWEGNISSNWGHSPNWSMGVPNHTRTARFVGGRPNYPVLDQNVEIAALIVDGGNIDLGGYTLQVNGNVTINGANPGAAGISNGILQASNFLQVEDITFTNVELQKTGANNTAFADDVIFNGTTVIQANSTAGFGSIFILGSTDGYDITFNGDVYFRNQGANTIIQIGAEAGTVALNGNVYLQNTQSGSYIRFGDDGTISVAADKAFKIDNDSYNTGTLYFRNVTQNGSAPNDTLPMGSLDIRKSSFGGVFAADLGTSLSMVDSSTFLSECTLIAPSLANIRNSVFQDTAVFNKTGSGANTWGGGNTFNSLCEINKSGSGSISTASLEGDTFNLDVKLKSAGTGDLRIGSDYGETSFFKKNIDFTNSAKPVIFGPGSMLLNGTTEQTLIGADSLTHHFDYLEVDNPDGVVLQMPINIGALLRFTDGIVQSSDTTAVTFLPSGSSLGASNTSHIDGLVRKLDLGFAMSFTFPVGDSSYYAPIKVRGASGTPDFEALYNYFDPDIAMYDASLIEAPIDHISRREHWLLNLLSSGSAYVTLSWDTRSKGVDEPADLVVARWDGSKWVSEGAGALLVNGSAGTIETAAPVTDFSPFTLASISVLNPLPIELLYFKASPVGKITELEWATATEQNNAYFTVERSADGRTFEDITTLPGAGNSRQMLVYRSIDEQPLEGISYYRLRQTDFDGASTFSDIVAVYRALNPADIAVFPMPSPNRRYTLQWLETMAFNQIMLYDSAGKICPVYPAMNDGQATLDLAHLPAGLYFALLQSPQQERWVKILVE